MKIASYNVNSVKARQHHIEDWIKTHNPDVMMLQELKSISENVPAAAFEDLGYQCFIKGQKAYNGVATLVKKEHEAELTSDILTGDESDEQARFLDINIGGVQMINIYLPNGNPVPGEKFDYKLKWMDRLYHYLKNYIDQRVPFLIGGDFNVMPEDIDCHDPQAWEGDALIHPDSRRAFRKLMHLGLTEAYRALHPHMQEFTFWDYQGGAWPQNHGIRIDHFLLSPLLADVLNACDIDKEPRDQEKASDHTPIWIDISPQDIPPVWRAA